MSLKERLAEELKAAMRAKDAVRLRTIRSLRAALMEREIAERHGGEAVLTEEQELAVVQKQAKQRRDAIEQYEQAGREDLAAKEREELEVLKDYLPRQLDESEVRTVVERIIAETGASSPREMGKVMGLAMKELRGKADGRMVQAVARALLSGEAG
ncbi:GatB/YqeY domain-containing protein [Rhodocaloribacter sp.]